MTTLTPTDLAQIAALLRATPHTLRSELTPLDPEILRWRPAAGQWCINEIIGHLIDTDRRAFAGRIQTMIAHNKPQLESWDVNDAVRRRRDAEKPVADLITQLETLRSDHAALVESLTPAQLARVGVHPKAGQLQVIDFVLEWPYHDRSHLKQILTIVQRHFWSKMGKIQQFIDSPE